MTVTLEKSASTSNKGLPAEVEDFVHKSIQSMDEKQLRAWKRESKKIMKKARRRVAAEVGDAAVAGEHRAARKMRQA